MTTKLTMDKIVNLCKNRGFVFPGSEIYGGFANTWDFGPVGVELKNNVKRAWWKRFVQESPNTYGVDASILMNPRVWEASGHVASFGDPKMDCKKCKQRFRADTLIESHSKGSVSAEAMTNEQLEAYINEHHLTCPHCGGFDWTPIRKFNPMFITSRGTLEEDADKVYLRPETCQGEYVNFLNVQRTARAKVPFAIAQIGKSFRNEITPGNFLFRTIEFEQMELEFFCKPGTDLEWFKYWKEFCKNWLLSLGMTEENIRLRDHSKEELCHYSAATSDIEYKFPFGWGELWGIADRTNFDLTQHQEFSGKNLEYFDAETNERYLPYVIEPSLGADRVSLAFLCDAYTEEKISEKDTRIVLKFHPALAPFKACVLPLSKKLGEGAEKIREELSKYFMVDYDEAGSIGKRYRRQDEIGTPLCITYDFDSENDECVTVRDRDTMEQERIKISDLKEYIGNKISF